MEEKGIERILYPQNYNCINCALLEGIEVDAAYLIWDEEDQKAVPLCRHCHEASCNEGNFFSTFSVN